MATREEILGMLDELKADSSLPKNIRSVIEEIKLSFDLQGITVQVFVRRHFFSPSIIFT